MEKQLNARAFAISLAIVSATGMLFLGIAGNIGIYTGAVQMMQQWHMFFSLSIGGIITGIIEAAIISFIAGWLIAMFYNKLL